MYLRCALLLGTTTRIKWTGQVYGRVVSEADPEFGISDVLVTSYLLTHAEHVDGRIAAWDFKEASITADINFREHAPEPAMCLQGYMCPCDGGTVYIVQGSPTSFAAVQHADHSKATHLRDIRCNLVTFGIADLGWTDFNCWCEYPSLEAHHVCTTCMCVTMRPKGDIPRCKALPPCSIM